MRVAIAVMGLACLLSAPVWAGKPEDPADPEDPDKSGALTVTSMTLQVGRKPWDEYDQRLKASQEVAALDAELFGDSVSLQNGALSFSTTDISLPGNDGLRVALSRGYTLANQKYAIHDEMLGDWSVQTPAISGTFASDWLSSGTPNNRCSDTLPPPLPTSTDVGIQYYLGDFFHGLTLDIPGVGGGELLVTGASTQRPSSGGPYRWVTNDQIHVSCLAAIANGTGEGFLAITPDGTKYWFDWMAQHVEPNLVKIAYPDASTGRAVMESTSRRRNLLLATRVEDRFGNWVTYTYTNAWNAPAKLSRIAAKDGRQIDLAYDADGRVASATDGTGTWQYGYGTTAKGGITLTTVTRPDGSRWTYAFEAFSEATIEYTESYVDGEIYRGCDWLEIPQNALDKLVATATHPSGATGTFTVGIHEHGRSNVPLSCTNFTSPYSQNNPNDDVNLFVISSHGLSLESKQLSGPGLTAATWTYAYASDISTHMYPGTTWDWPVCTVGAQCYEPPCTTDACAGTSRTEVAGPGNEWTRYTFGNSFRYNEGKLLKVEQGSSATAILQTRVDTHDLDWADKAYPARFGDSLQMNHDGFANEYHRPLLRSDTQRQGETFSWQVEADCALPGGLCMDGFARPLEVRRGSTLGFSRVEETAYHDNTARWVLGQTLRLKCLAAVPGGDACDGDIVTEATYDPATALPLTHKAFGKLQHALAYHADGTLASYQDGRNLVTTLANWYRGVPRLITHPDATTQSATVNPDGTIASVTNETGARTCYGYDAMGRLGSITHPSESQAGVCDTSAWNTTTQSFTQVQASEYGILAGHWRQTVQTGNGRRFVYFDALWRPLLVREDDAGNAATERFTRFAHDHAGRQTFAAYPATTSTATAGVHTTYDALGRVRTVTRDSELGPLVTTSEYLSGFQTRLTTPRGTATTTGFQAWDTPGTEHPTDIADPEGAFTDIARDPFGKPRAITRRNAAGTVGVSRELVYDTAQQLCKTIEPETGATVLAYDAAGNLAWSATGQPLPDPATCDLASVPGGERVARTYDPRNRVLTLRFPDGQGDQDWAYTADGLPAQITTWNGANQTLPVINAYDYNARRLLGGQGESISQPGWYTWSLGYGYDRNGQRANHVYPTGLVVDYAPNALGQATQAGSFATGASYHPDGTLAQFTYGNGIVHTTTRTLRGLPGQRTDQDPATGSQPFQELLDYDPHGNVVGITDGATGQNQRGNRDLVYDGLDRLTSAASPLFGTASYGYDVLDNLTRVTVSGGSTPRDHHYCHDASNRLTNIKTGSCAGATVVGLGYDVRGNVVNQNGRQHLFDQGNRLRDIANVEHYRYDGLGRRVLAWAPGLGSILSQYDRAGRIVYQDDQRRLRGTDHVYLGARLVAQRERTLPGGTNPVVAYQHTDALGSPVAVTDAGRSVVQRSEYEPYGKLLNRANDDRPGYTGHVMDAATGLTYMQQRYYDPGIGMFLSVDPMASDMNNGWNFNRYNYAAHNPYKFTDPDGRVINFALGAGLGAVIDIAAQQIAEPGANINWKSVGVSALTGALTGGVGGGLTKLAAARAISTKVATRGTVATGAVAGATSANIQAMENGSGPSLGATVLGGTIGAATAGFGAVGTNSGQAMNLARMSSAPINSPAGIGSHVAQNTAVSGNASGAIQAAGSALTKVGTEATGKLIEKVVEVRNRP